MGSTNRVLRMSDVISGVENLIISEYDYSLTRLTVGSYRLSVVYHYYDNSQDQSSRRGITRCREVHVDIEEIYSPDIEYISFTTGYDTKRRTWTVEFEVGVDYCVEIGDLYSEDESHDVDDPSWEDDDSD